MKDSDIPDPRKPRKRKCLKCGKMFDSANAANRICRKCARINDNISLPRIVKIDKSVTDFAEEDDRWLDGL